MFKELAGLGSLLKQAREISGRMQGLAEELKCRRATGAAGGGMVEIEVNGAGEVLACRMEPPLVAGGDRELIEDLVVTAVNQALGKAKQLHAEAMQSLAGNLNVPGLDEAMGKLLGGGASGPVDE